MDKTETLNGLNLREQIDLANQQALKRMVDSQPTWVGMDRAINVIPGMTKDTILHAGPPIEYKNMCRPQQVGVCGAMVYERLAPDMDTAAQMASAGDINLDSCHNHRTVGSMGGITSASMPVIIVRNETYGNEAYCIIYESPSAKRLSFGCYDQDVFLQLKWLEETMYPALDYAITQLGSLNLKRIIARALSMGDECHSRHWAATALIGMELMPVWLKGSFNQDKAAEAARFIAQSDQFFLHFTMAACKATADSAHGIEYSSLVTAIARNGVEVGIRVSGLPGQWFTGPAGLIEGLYFSGYTIADSNPDLGDSAITETVGLGAAAMAAAPAFEVVGGTLEKALNTTLEINEISVGNNPNFPIATLNGMGSPTGIDIRLVLKKGIVPTIDTGIAHKDGNGQIGVGNSKAPIQAFEKAVKAYGQKYLLS
ncbi:MAG: YlbE family protein [Anaerolineaceae bacterium]